MQIVFKNAAFITCVITGAGATVKLAEVLNPRHQHNQANYVLQIITNKRYKHIHIQISFNTMRIIT